MFSAVLVCSSLIAALPARDRPARPGGLRGGPGQGRSRSEGACPPGALVRAHGCGRADEAPGDGGPGDPSNGAGAGA